MQKALAFRKRIMHNGAMRTHTEIIRKAGEEAVKAATQAPINTVRSWAQRDSIPAPQWAAMVDAGFCTADELIAAAAKRAA
jgi:hypothetical protein